jgi:hypothetical protein
MVVRPPRGKKKETRNWREKNHSVCIWKGRTKAVKQKKNGDIGCFGADKGVHGLSEQPRAVCFVAC